MVIDMGPILRGEVNRMNFEYTLDPIPMDRITFLFSAEPRCCLVNSTGDSLFWGS